MTPSTIADHATTNAAQFQHYKLFAVPGGRWYVAASGGEALDLMTADDEANGFDPSDERWAEEVPWQRMLEMVYHDENDGMARADKNHRCSFAERWAWLSYTGKLKPELFACEDY